MIFNYNLGPEGRLWTRVVISSCIYKIDYFTILAEGLNLVANKINEKYQYDKWKRMLTRICFLNVIILSVLWFNLFLRLILFQRNFIEKNEFRKNKIWRKKWVLKESFVWTNSFQTFILWKFDWSREN
jgi:hypothetical protein